MLPATFVALICTFDQSGCCCCASADGTNSAAPAIARKGIATTNVTTVKMNDLFRMCLPQVKRRAFYHSISAHLQGSVAPIGPMDSFSPEAGLEAKIRAPGRKAAPAAGTRSRRLGHPPATLKRYSPDRPECG